MTIPDAAIEAVRQVLLGWRQHPKPTYNQMAEELVEAAMPAIREAIAQEIEATNTGNWVDGQGMAAAARIVRGGTP